MIELKRKTYYLAGPMSGIPQFNFPAFHQAAKDLRLAGYIVISPAEEDSLEVQAHAMSSKTGAFDPGDKLAGETWGAMLGRDVELIADVCDGVILLPNWHKSKGARLEAFVGLLCDYPIYEWRYSELLECNVAKTLDLIRHSFK